MDVVIRMSRPIGNSTIPSASIPMARAARQAVPRPWIQDPPGVHLVRRTQVRDERRRPCVVAGERAIHRSGCMCPNTDQEASERWWNDHRVCTPLNQVPIVVLDSAEHPVPHSRVREMDDIAHPVGHISLEHHHDRGRDTSSRVVAVCPTRGVGALGMYLVSCRRIHADACHGGDAALDNRAWHGYHECVRSIGISLMLPSLPFPPLPVYRQRWVGVVGLLFHGSSSRRNSCMIRGSRTQWFHRRSASISHDLIARKTCAAGRHDRLWARVSCPPSGHRTAGGRGSRSDRATLAGVRDDDRRVGRCSVAGCPHLGMTGHGDDDHCGHRGHRA
jgi:hypothetical protein